jgi:hypothetical protein
MTLVWVYRTLLLAVGIGVAVASQQHVLRDPLPASQTADAASNGSRNVAELGKVMIITASSVSRS